MIVNTQCSRNIYYVRQMVPEEEIINLHEGNSNEISILITLIFACSIRTIKSGVFDIPRDKLWLFEVIVISLRLAISNRLISR